MDVYSTHLRGVIFTYSDLWAERLVDGETLRVTGAIIGRDIHVEGRVVVTQLDELLRDPPRGLSDPTPMRFVGGTMRRVPAP